MYKLCKHASVMGEMYKNMFIGHEKFFLDMDEAYSLFNSVDVVFMWAFFFY